MLYYIILYYIVVEARSSFVEQTTRVKHEFQDRMIVVVVII